VQLDWLACSALHLLLELLSSTGRLNLGIGVGNWALQKWPVLFKDGLAYRSRSWLGSFFF
jgi:hypothetical protein